MKNVTAVFREGTRIMHKTVDDVLILDGPGVLIKRSQDRVSVVSYQARERVFELDALPALYHMPGFDILLCEGPDVTGLLKFGPSLFAASSVMLNALYWTAVYAQTSEPLLILGESGSGKEEFARFAHHVSGRGGPFVAVNVGGMPVTLAESELFGHRKGAFTGAASNRSGLFELAKHGTIFLDEVGDAPMSLQTKLLRVVENGEFRVLGSSNVVKTDCRVIAATNRDLRSGNFRFDLYQRLSPLTVHLPPLRQRSSRDIQGLVKAIAAQKGRYNLGLTKEAAKAVVSYPWMGNVRELSAFVTRLVLVADANRITERDVQLAMSMGQTRVVEPLTFRDSADAAIYDAFLRDETGKSVYSKLGMSKSTYYDRLKRIKVQMA